MARWKIPYLDTHTNPKEAGAEPRPNLALLGQGEAGAPPTHTNIMGNLHSLWRKQRTTPLGIDRVPTMGKSDAQRCWEQLTHIRNLGSKQRGWT